jgi:hypothetical protein
VGRENLEVARQLYPAQLDLAQIFAGPDRLAVMRAAQEPLVHPDFETVADPDYVMLLGTPAGGEPGQTVFVGIDGFVNVFREWLAAWESWTVTPREFVDLPGERVLVEIEIVGRSKAAGMEISTEGGNVLTFGDHRLRRLELFFRREDARRAAGV